MQMHKQSTQFDPSQYISKKHYKYQKGGAQKRPQSNDTCKLVVCMRSPKGENSRWLVRDLKVIINI